MTKESELFYIIPPYILDTTYGWKFQQDIKSSNNQMGESNVMTSESPFFASIANRCVPKYHFSSDPILHNIIKEKFLYKLQIIGVLGTVTKRTEEYSDEEVYELFQTFGPKIMSYESDKPASSDKPSKNAFESDSLGEVELPIPNDSTLPKKYHKFYHQPLKKLLENAEFELTGSLDSGILKLSSLSVHKLPASWIPITLNSKISSLNLTLLLETSFEDGFPTIEFSTRRNGTVTAPKYLNFITDRDVRPTNGIYYYEVEIEQSISAATKMQSLLSNLNKSLSSNNAPHFCIGFTKRYIQYELRSNPSTTNPTSFTHQSMDLESVKQDLKYNREKSKPTNTSIETLLDAKPGEFKGSFALDLSDLNFYNSIKGSESAHRTTLLSMSRRLSALSRQHLEELDPGKVDTEVEFSSNKVSDLGNKEVSKSDVIGFGINFYSKTLFITLNGVLITTINNEDLTSNNTSSGNLFEENKIKSSVYPMIGFKLNELILEDVESYEPTKLKIKTNLGYKDFKFNIQNYVKSLKEEANRKLDLYLLAQIQDVKKGDHQDNIEMQLLNVDDNSLLINKLIKGYLYTEGYIDTFKALESDIREVKHADTPSINADSSVIAKSNGAERQVIKQYFRENKFSEALEFIHEKFGGLFQDPSGLNILFEIKLHELIFTLKAYLEKLFTNNDEFAFENKSASIAELYNKALDLATQLTRENEEHTSRINEIRNISLLLLVKDMTAYNKVPTATAILDNYSERIKDLSDKVNKRILRGLKFQETSNLETIVKTVGKNINSLVFEQFDDLFGLINYEKDYLSL